MIKDLINYLNLYDTYGLKIVLQETKMKKLDCQYVKNFRDWIYKKASSSEDSTSPNSWLSNMAKEYST